MSDGLDTKLQERGGRLSVGQRQLLVFAAVLLADPRILILDEATSSIDVFSELKIQKSIQLLLKNRTSFIIAHRLSTIRNADTIIVIDDGQIIEQGTHDELISQKGDYYDLVKNQIELSSINR
jgi:ATP-binding cassette subfamily B protein